MSYRREIPRDLFNEAKLLKCLGQLSLMIEDGFTHRWPLRLDYTGGGPFVIEQDPSDGGLYCFNVRLFCGEREIPLKTGLNSRDPYPLIFEDEAGAGDWQQVFWDDGKLRPWFMGFLDGLTGARIHGIQLSKEVVEEAQQAREKLMMK